MSDRKALIARMRAEVQSRTALEVVLSNPAVREFARGGEDLSERQRGLLATAVAVIQQDVISYLQQEVEAQRRMTLDLVGGMTFAAVLGVKRGWRTPLVTAEGGEGGDGDRRGRKNRGDEDPRARLWNYVNWGNFVTVAAVALLAVAIFFTKAYASYKDRAEAQAEYIADLQKNLGDADKKNVELEKKTTDLTTRIEEADGQRTYWQATAETVQEQLDSLNVQVGKIPETSEVMLQLESTRADLAKAISDRDTMVGSLNRAKSSAKTYEDLYSQEKNRRTRAENRAAELNKENRQLKNEGCGESAAQDPGQAP
ncbi:MAG: hypothetical protein ACRERC_06755 [Candidatus Binatia bacterium]